MKMAVFQWFRSVSWGPPHLGPLPGLLLASCWRLAGVLLASSWPLAGFLLASSFPTRISLENQFLGKLAKTLNSLHENGCFSLVSVFRETPSIWGSFLASCWRLAGLLLASCWLLAGLLLASSWPFAGFLLASSFPTRISLENRFLGRLAKTVNSLHENGCFSMVSVFRGVPPIWGLFLASCWRLAGLLLASCWRLAGVLLASCWPLAGLLLASSWPLAGFLLASSFPTRISLENRFLGRLAKTVNSLHENGCFSMVSVFRGVPLISGIFLASCWPLPGFLLASCWRLAGVLLACCWLLLASCWPLAGLLLVFLASCWLLAGFKLPHEDFSRKSVFAKARENGEFSS